MNKFKIWSVLSMLLFLLTIQSCKEEKLPAPETIDEVCLAEHPVYPCNTDPTKANIRVANNLGADVCNMLLSFYRNTNYGHIGIGETTCYVDYDVAYDYGKIDFIVNDNGYMIQPFDFTGEPPLAPGNYTYSLDSVGSQYYEVYFSVIED